jgi:hypothetical protein
MNQFRRVERWAFAFPPEVGRREFFQFAINERNYSIYSLWVTGMDTS